MKTDREVKVMKLERNKGKLIRQAAAAGNMCEKTARKYLKSGVTPSQTKSPRKYRTRADVFSEVWDSIVPFLEENERLEAKTLFEHLQRENPGKFQDGQLRSFQRKLKVWRATQGPNKEVYFPQEYKPGYQCQSDFSHMKSLGVTINRQPFDHLIYHFVLPYSNWEDATICFSESFEALSEGLQNALWKLSKVPTEHRTDRLSAAINNHCNKEEFTESYKYLLEYYKLKASKTNPYSGNENGDVEQAHNRLKKYIDQKLMLRGSRDFASQEEYSLFLRQCLNHKNRNRTYRLEEELKNMTALPLRRMDDFKRISARVTKFSTIRVAHSVYSVPSRLIGEEVYVHLYAGRLEVYYADRKIEEMPRLRGESTFHIQYRHVIDSLVRKPGAFENYQYKSCMFPSSYFKMVYDNLKDKNPTGYVKLYLKILKLAAYEGEELVEGVLIYLIESNEDLCLESIKQYIQKRQLPQVEFGENIPPVNLATYDDFLEGVLL
ncbi:MAG: IS21 family transposase [Desulfobacterales bacterium]